VDWRICSNIRCWREANVRFERTDKKLYRELRSSSLSAKPTKLEMFLSIKSWLAAAGALFVRDCGVLVSDTGYVVRSLARSLSTGAAPV